MQDVWPLSWAIPVFVAGAAVVVAGGARMSNLADRLADRTGWGEAVFGSMMLGAAISLSGVVMTATAAYNGLPAMGYSNAVGGIAAQTVALAVADMAYRRANLEHAAASLANIFFGTLLIGMLAVAALVSLTPDWTIGWFHPGSFLLIGFYVYGQRISRAVSREPLWAPEPTSETREDEPEEDESSRSMRALFLEFAALAGAVSVGGWAVARGAESIAEHTGLSETVVGGVLMGVVNALPEVVVSLAAVRRGALTMAVAGVLGGNAFDVLNLSVGDLFYRGGSIYHAVGRADRLLLLISVVMTATLVAGLIRRERKGPLNIGFESLAVILLYLAGVALVWLA